MRYDYRELLNQQKDLEQQYKKTINQLDLVKNEVNTFNGEPNFSGKFAESTKQYMAEIHLMMPHLLSDYFKSSISEYNKALSKATSLVDKDQKAIIETKTLENMQKKFKSSKRKMAEIDSNVQDVLSSVSKYIGEVTISKTMIDNEADNCIKALDKVIDDVESLSNQKFTESLKSKKQEIENFLKKVGKIDITTFKPGDVINMVRTMDIKGFILSLPKEISDQLIKRPEEMSDKQFLDYCDKVNKEVEQLKKDGWDDGAIKVFVDKLDEDVNVDNYLEQINKNVEELHKLGSDLYNEMFKGSRLSAKERADLVIKQMGGEIDENGMLQLDPKSKYKFDKDMPPHGDFLKEYAKAVQEAYKDKDILDDPMIHQFRMYIDRHNINYIRTKFGKDKNGNALNDRDALMEYINAKKPSGLGGKPLDYEPARYHNKYPDGTTYKDFVKSNNRKRVLNFHSEFILDENGNFVSQWNVLQTDKNGKVISDPKYYYDSFTEDRKYGDERKQNFEKSIVNSESFNYASDNDKTNKNHTKLDIYPPPKHDNKLRKKISKEWNTPKNYPPKYPKNKKDSNNEYNYKSDNKFKKYFDYGGDFWKKYF